MLYARTGLNLTAILVGVLFSVIFWYGVYYVTRDFIEMLGVLKLMLG